MVGASAEARRLKFGGFLLRLSVVLHLLGFCALYFYPIYYSRNTYIDENAIASVHSSQFVSTLSLSQIKGVWSFYLFFFMKLTSEKT